MSLNGRLSSLHLHLRLRLRPPLVDHASQRRPLLVRPQTRALNEFITRSQQPSPALPSSCRANKKSSFRAPTPPTTSNAPLLLLPHPLPPRYKRQHHDPPRRWPHDMRLEHSRRPRLPIRGHHSRPAQAPRRRPGRQDEPGRVRHGRAQRQLSPRPCRTGARP